MARAALRRPGDRPGRGVGTAAPGRGIHEAEGPGQLHQDEAGGPGRLHQDEAGEIVQLFRLKHQWDKPDQSPKSLLIIHIDQQYQMTIPNPAAALEGQPPQITMIVPLHRVVSRLMVSVGMRRLPGTAPATRPEKAVQSALQKLMLMKL